METSDVLIVGGGIAGLSCAFYLARAGKDVTVIEKDRVGAGASGGAAGMIVNPMFVAEDTPYSEMDSFARLNRMGYRAYPQFLEEIGVAAETVGYANDGSYYLAFDESQLAKRKSYFGEMVKYDRPVNWLDPAETRQWVPAVSGSVQGGFFYEDEARIIPGALLDRLKAAVTREGARLLEGEAVVGADLSDPTTVELQTETSTFTGGKLIVTAGAWSGLLGETFGLDVKVSPRRGQMLRIHHEALDSIPVIKEGDRFLVPRPGPQAIVGATMDADAGFSSEVREQATQKLLTSASRMIDFDTPPEIIKEWVGLRPYAERKGGPFLGPVPDQPSVYLCAGHYKNGITQGPVTARMVADCLLGKKPLEILDDYRPDR